MYFCLNLGQSFSDLKILKLLTDKVTISTLFLMQCFLVNGSNKNPLFLLSKVNVLAKNILTLNNGIKIIQKRENHRK